MHESVQDGGGDDGVAEHVAPSREALIARQDHRSAFIAATDELEEQVRAESIDRQVTDLVDDQQPRRRVELQLLVEPAFAIAFVLALLSTALVFAYLRTTADVFWMIPLMGFCQLALFGGYAVYFPELFPTRLRSTGVSFCYNVGRFVAALGPTALGLLTSRVFAAYPEPERMRYAGLTMCLVADVGVGGVVDDAVVIDMKWGHDLGVWWWW